MLRYDDREARSWRMLKITLMIFLKHTSEKPLQSFKQGSDVSDLHFKKIFLTATAGGC